MNWTITKDKIDTNCVGRGTFKGNAESLPYAFRLLDADNNVDYHGRSDDRNSEAAFEPLDWAQAYAGSTAIEYYVNNRWEML